MLYVAKRTWFVERHLCIQSLLSGLVDYDASVFKDAEIGTLENLVLSRADKNEFYLSC